MAKLRGMRKGGNVFDDLGKKIRNTFTPKLGRDIKNALTSGTAKKNYRGIADVGSVAIGQPELGAVANIGIDAALGSGLKKKRLYRKKNTMCEGSTLINGVPTVILKNDRKRINTHQMGACGGSFLSPNSISGGSFI